MIFFLFEFAVNHFFLFTLCCLVVSTVVLKCMDHIRTSMNIEKAQKQREDSLHLMEKVITGFKEQVCHSQKIYNTEIL
ncbi:hypothetical protein XENTR_v10011997 [Xenopus tropicalis]|nr:hypothetical protein XENTR_v10011997 [Xenopus tropicalis]